MDINLYSTIIRELKEIASVEVVLSENPAPNESVITIDTMKMKEIIAGYNHLQTIVQKTWSNLPSPPVKEKTHVFVWLIASVGYCVNYSTIKWPGSSPNTFVHMWSIMDRIKSSLTVIDTNWLVGPRDCVQYCLSTGMKWPMDSHMYQSQQTSVDQIKLMEMRPEVFKFDPTTREFDSFYDFHMSTRTRKKMPMINVTRSGLSEITKASLHSRSSRPG